MENEQNKETPDDQMELGEDELVKATGGTRLTVTLMGITQTIYLCPVCSSDKSDAVDEVRIIGGREVHYYRKCKRCGQLYETRA